jgi:Fe(3+) dicitrate transport protein
MNSWKCFIVAYKYESFSFLFEDSGEKVLTGGAVMSGAGVAMSNVAGEVMKHEPTRGVVRSAFRPSPMASALLAVFVAGPALAQTEPAAQERVLPRVDVIGTGASKIDLAPGSAAVIDGRTLEESRVFNVNEALRKVPGVHVREEEGVGLRPNIGIRGMNPTRSTKVLLLEDGLPLSYAPYGDNASYYHPPIDRYDAIEVSKGSQVIRFGPQTAGGVINYITPEPQKELGGFVGLAGGTRGYLNAHVMVTGNGAMLDYYRKESGGSRENMNSKLDDLNFKWAGQLNEDHKLVLRATHFREYSQLTYAGLTQAEFLANPRQNAFKNDFFDATRSGFSATHEWRIDADRKLLTSVYGAYFDRDWWRQASSSTDCSGRNLGAAAGCAVNGRLRSYTTAGIDTRMLQRVQAFGIQNDLEYGLKFHHEVQRRRQEQYANYADFLSDTRPAGFLQENQKRRTQAVSAFVSNRMQFTDRLAITPIARVEHIRNDRVFYADNNNSTANSGSVPANFTEFIPGVGATYRVDETTVVYGGVHKGFSPPRVEDAISGGGTVVDLRAERSVNAELGVRTSPVDRVSLDVAVFRNDFSNLIQVGSIAGGGSIAYSEGKALFQGLEFAGQFDRITKAVDGNLFTRAAWTWLPTAEQQSRFVQPNGTVAVDHSGKRLPYAPENLLTLTVGYRAPQHWNARVDYVYVGEQFSDFANTPAPTVSGQQGIINAHGIWNAVANYTIGNTTFFIAGKNLSDKTYVVDRTRGIQVGMPRTFQAGLKYAF